MKRILPLLLLGSIAFLNAHAQKMPNFSAIKLVNKEDYDSAADDAALKAANYILSSPVSVDDLLRTAAIKYMITWDEGTPGYNFTIGPKATKLATQDGNLLILFMAGMTKYALLHKSNAKDSMAVQESAAEYLIAYVKDPANNIQIKGELKKLISADDKGKLDEYFQIK